MDMITYSDPFASGIDRLSQALGVLNTVTNIPDLRGEDAANFLADAFDLCLQISQLGPCRSPYGLLKTLPYRGIVKLTQRFGGLPSSVLLSNEELEIGRVLGEGAYGYVHFGKYKVENVAIKVPRNQCSRREVLKEFVFGIVLHHVHVLQSLGVIDMPSMCRPRIITPLMANGNVRDYIASEKPSPQDICRLISEFADGMAYIHSLNIVHGDLRAPNLLIDKDGHLKISDFGKAGFNGSTAPSSGAEAISAAGYIAPELTDVDSELPYPPRPSLTSDIFAFGSACYEVFVGQPPFHGMYAPRVYVWVHRGRRCERVQEIPEPVWNLIRSCWEHVPSERPSAQGVFHRAQKLVESQDSGGNAALTAVHCQVS